MIDIKQFLGRISSQYRLNPHDVHGLSHWARVLDNGSRLADIEGGDLTVIRLFAIFHDACRKNQSIDPGHGARGAVLAGILLQNHPEVSKDQLELLQKACRGHTDGKTRANLTIQICWDSDRLDLGRVNIMPSHKFLCTDAAKSDAILSWANQRALAEYIPEYVFRDWDPLFPIDT